MNLSHGMVIFDAGLRIQGVEEKPEINKLIFFKYAMLLRISAFWQVSFSTVLTVYLADKVAML